MDTTTVWLCGRWNAKGQNQINGIFSTKEGAITRCKDGYDYVAPFALDEEQPEEDLPMEDQYYPIPLTKEIE